MGKNGYGSLLLHRVEDYLHLEHNANMVTALVWERQGESTHQFYEKNGYTHMPHEREQHYDDGVSVYDLMPYIKLLPTQLSRRDEYALNDVPDAQHLEMQIIVEGIGMIFGYTNSMKDALMIFGIFHSGGIDFWKMKIL